MPKKICSTPAEVFEKLSSNINIAWYLSPKEHKLLADHCNKKPKVAVKKEAFK